METLPFSRVFILLANIALCGFPFLAGFYSKDAWIEIVATSAWGAPLMALFYLSLVLTVAYRARILASLFF